MYVLLMPLWEGFPYGVMQVRIEKIYIAVLVTPGNKLIITWGITPFCVHLPGGGRGGDTVGFNSVHILRRLFILKYKVNTLTFDHLNGFILKCMYFSA